MAETITITDPKIVELIIDVENEKVILHWEKTTVSGGVRVESGKFIFWKTLPESPEYNWRALGSTELTALGTILSMAQDFLDNM